VVATATDIASLCGTCPAPTLRNYAARVARTDFVKETAARIVIGALARSALLVIIIIIIVKIN